MNIQQALKNAIQKLNSSNTPSANLDAEVLLSEALNKSRHRKLDKSWLYTHNNYELSRNEEKLFNDFIDQRKKQKPVAYIINRKEFYGYDFYVDENTLIPRPETELIVDEVLEIITGVHALACKNSNLNKINSSMLKPELRNLKCSVKKKITLIDIGTGSGCIIISILNELKKIKNKNTYSAYANDISKKAIKIAKINAREYNLDKKIKFAANSFEKFIKKEFSSAVNQFIITANLPYIKDDEYKKLLPNVKKYEPKIALTAGKNGLVYIEKLIDLISKIQLKSNQKIYLLLEADPDQISKITAISREKLANVNIKIIKDLNSNKRLILLCC